MSNNIVTQRFVKFHDKLRATKRIKSSRQFAIELEYLPQSLSEILKGRRDVTIEVIRKAVEIYKLNPIFIFLGEGDMFLSEEMPDTRSLRVLTVVTDADSHDEKILHVPVPAQTAYAAESKEAAFIKSLPSFTLPDYKYRVGTHRSFDVAGDAMEPTLFEGDKVVCSFIEPSLWEASLKEGYVYVLVTNDDVILRRIVGHDKTQKTLSLKSDNLYYPVTALALSQISEIWYVRAKISPFLPAPNRIQHLFLEEVQTLKATVGEQSRVIENLNKTIERLLEQM